jgi:hypothetical protein
MADLLSQALGRRPRARIVRAGLRRTPLQRAAETPDRHVPIGRLGARPHRPADGVGREACVSNQWSNLN